MKQNISDDIWSFTPSKTLKVEKKIWNPQLEIFEPVTFVRVSYGGSELSTAIEFHTECYGKPKRQGQWWHDRDSIWLRSELATFWLLKMS